MTRLTAGPGDRFPATGKAARRPRKQPARRRSGSAPAAKQPRRPWLKRWLRRAAVVSVLLVVFGISGGLAWLWRSGWIATTTAAIEQQFLEATVAHGFGLGEIEVLGRDNTPTEAVLGALGLHRGEPLIAIDLESARSRLEAIGWVRRATVERRWPDTIRVRLEERRPLALWQHQGDLAVVDATGVVITEDESDRFGHLPLVVGADAARHAEALLEALATEASIRERIAAAVRVSGRRWNLRTERGIDIQLPETDIVAALDRLVTLQREQALLDRAVTTIDLRLPDRLTVQEAEDAAEAAEGKDA